MLVCEIGRVSRRARKAGMPPASAKKRARLGPGRLSAENAEALPDRLMDAAFVLFTSVGFEGATMDAIAKQAGASTKTLYSRFSNKSEILEAVVRRNVQRTVADHLRGFALKPEESDPRDFLYKFAMQIGAANLADETAGLVRVTFAEAHRYPVLRRMYNEVTGRAIVAITEALRIWRETGKLDFEGDPKQLAVLAFGLLTNEMRIRAVLGDPLSRAELPSYVGAATDLFLQGIAKQEPAKRTKRK
jgi:TetR/AcrR family transcriptional regulator, mexJK operon transcriptional repressor